MSSIEQLEERIRALREERDALTEQGDAYDELTDRIEGLNYQLERLRDTSGQASGAMSSLGVTGVNSATAMIEGLTYAATEGVAGLDSYYRLNMEVGGELLDNYTAIHTRLGYDFQNLAADADDSSFNMGRSTVGMVRTMHDAYYGIGEFQNQAHRDLTTYFGKLEDFTAYSDQVYESFGSGYRTLTQIAEDPAAGNAMVANSAIIARGLGYNATEMMDVMDAAMSRSGEFNEESLLRMATFSNAVASETGDSQKVIARGMMEIMTDFETFGTVTEEQAAVTVAGLRSIGLEVKDLSSITSHFMNFDSAAESLANLNTVFGMQIDTMAMMEAASEDPFEAMMMLREGFLDTGRSFEDLTMQQRSLLASQFQLGPEMAQRLLDPSAILNDMSDLQGAVQEASADGIMTTEEAIAQLESGMGRVTNLQTDFSSAVYENMAKRDVAALAHESALAASAMSRLALSSRDLSESNLIPPEMLEEIDQVRRAFKQFGSEAQEASAQKFLEMGQTGITYIAEGMTSPEGQARLIAAGDVSAQTIYDETTSQLYRIIQNEGIEAINMRGEVVEIDISEEAQRALEQRIGLDLLVPVETPATPADDVYAPQVGSAMSLNAGDEVLIGMQGGPIVRSIYQFGEGVLSQVQAMAPGEFERSGVVLAELAAQQRSLIEEAIQLSSDRETLAPAAGQRAAENRPINLSLNVRLADRTLLQLKEELINAGDAGGLDFMVETVA